MLTAEEKVLMINKVRGRNQILREKTKPISISSLLRRQRIKTFCSLLESSFCSLLGNRRVLRSVLSIVQTDELQQLKQGYLQAEPHQTFSLGLMATVTMVRLNYCQHIGSVIQESRTLLQVGSHLSLWAWLDGPLCQTPAIRHKYGKCPSSFYALTKCFLDSDTLLEMCGHTRGCLAHPLVPYQDDASNQST